MFWPLSPGKIKLGCENVLRIEVLPKIKIGGTGAITDPILVSPLDGMMAIQAYTAADITNQTLCFLNEAYDCGWTFGNAFFLKDGWRNEFYLNKAETKSVLAFDLRPTLEYVRDALELTIATMAVAGPPGTVSEIYTDNQSNILNN